MVQKIPYHQFTGNTVTLGSSTSRVIMGADSGNLKIQDSQSNTSIIEPGLKDGIIGAGLNATVYANTSVVPLASTKPVGHLAWATANNSVFVRGETGWYKIATTNESPTVTLSKSSPQTITSSSLTLDFTYTTDDDAKVKSVAVSNTKFATVGNVAITHTTSNNHVRAVFDGTTSYTGATITVTATDGISQGSSTMTINTDYQTTFAFDTSHASINSTYTTDNKVEAYPQFATGGGNAYSTNTGKLGKGYLECKVISLPNGTHSYQYGLTSGKGSGGHLFNAFGVHVGPHGENYSTVYPGVGSDSNNSNDVIGARWAVGDIIQMAYDTNAGNGQVWFGRNGSWPSNYNPNEGDAGWGVSSSADVSTEGFRLSFGQSHTGSGGRGAANRAFRVEIISHTQGAQYTIPSGWALA